VKFSEYYKKNSKPRVVLMGGIHGDEPAGNIASKKFKNVEGVYVISDINKTGKRRLNNVDPNRHFDQDDELPVEKDILDQIEEIKPTLVIAMHEDDTTDEVYAYSSPDMVDKLKAVLKELNVKLAKSAIGDKTDHGVISHGHLPTKGTLERALRKRGISSCTIETPVKTYDLETRVMLQVEIVKSLLLQLQIKSDIVKSLWTT
jgi:predicted deacylase